MNHESSWPHSIYNCGYFVLFSAASWPRPHVFLVIAKWMKTTVFPLWLVVSWWILNCPQCWRTSMLVYSPVCFVAAHLLFMFTYTWFFLNHHQPRFSRPKSLTSGKVSQNTPDKRMNIKLLLEIKLPLCHILVAIIETHKIGWSGPTNDPEGSIMINESFGVDL